MLLILAAVAINLTIGDNGILTRAEQAAEEMRIQSVKEKLELAKGPAIIEGKGHINPDRYFEIIEEEGIIGSKENDVINKGDGTYEVTTVEGYVFLITLQPSIDDVRDLEIEYIGKTEGPRIVKIEITNITTNSVTVKVETKNAEDGTYTYSYKKASEGEDNWKEVEKSKNNTGTIGGLEQRETYDIRVEIEKDGKSAIRKISVNMEELPEGTITFTNLEWIGDGTAKVVINNSLEGIQLQYQINGTEADKWINTTSGAIIEGLTYPSTVYGRLWDGTNESEHVIITIEDKNEPTISNIETSNITANSVTVTVTAVDNESGLATNGTYEYYLNSESTPKKTTTENSYTYTGLASETNYTLRVVVRDKAGLTKEASTTVTTSYPTVDSTLKEGNFVYYVDGKGITRKCAVLYGPGSAYGIQIITMDTVEDVTIGDSYDTSTATISQYNRLISTLNVRASSYTNHTYSTSARCVGSVPNNSYSESGMYKNSERWFSDYNGKLKGPDNNYVTDLNQMKALSISGIGESYWFASRCNKVDSDKIYFGNYHSTTNGGAVEAYWCSADNEHHFSYSSRTDRLRPVFTLKSGIRITGGDGSEVSPYTLGV